MECCSNGVDGAGELIMDDDAMFYGDYNKGVYGEVEYYDEAALEPQPEPIMVAEWALTCEAVLQTLDKHPYVDLRSTSVVANFHVPVVSVYPQLRERYLSVIR